MKIRLLESSLVGAKMIMMEKEKEHSRQDEGRTDMQISEDIMFKNNKAVSANNNGSASTTKVVVLGAGLSPANGIYLYNGAGTHTMTSDVSSTRHHHQQKQLQDHHCLRDNGMLVFEKEAVWNQQRVTFLLYPVSSGQYYTQYKLGVRSQTAPTTKVLYNSPTTVVARGANGLDGGVTIPEQAWEVEDDATEGLHPPPQFVGRVVQPVSTWNKSLTHSLI